MSYKPKVIMLFSGKRKCGKDYVTDLIIQNLNTEDTVVIKISGPIKQHWAKERGLDFTDLLSPDIYKEKYRQEMIEWGESMRKKDAGIFCREAIKQFSAEDKSLWIVSDIRRQTDIKWFKETYGDVVKTVRIVADNETRGSRGWIFKKGVDDVESECDLDNYSQWDWIIENGSSNQLTLEEQLKPIILFIDSHK